MAFGPFRWVRSFASSNNNIIYNNTGEKFIFVTSKNQNDFIPSASIAKTITGSDWRTTTAEGYTYLLMAPQDNSWVYGQTYLPVAIYNGSGNSNCYIYRFNSDGTITTQDLGTGVFDVNIYLEEREVTPPPTISVGKITK